MPGRAERVLVVGLDCATPRFLFGPDAFDLPHLQGLAESGAWTTLRSCEPPITVPAWACMTTGRDPGELGCYGFRSRAGHSYEPLERVDGTAIREPRIWDYLGEAALQSVCVGIPQTFPPRPLNGCLVAGVLTPEGSKNYAYPKALAQELEDAVGPVKFDVAEYRTTDKAALLNRLHDFLHNRFNVAEYLMRSKPWDFFMMVDMGLDRLHHGFWKHCDPDHSGFEPGNPFESAFADYYAAMDERIGNLLQHVPDGTAILAVSDHGARALEGGFCINQWLIDEGYLAVNDDLQETKRLDDCTIDWSRTAAWATGGYVARIYLNVCGREPNGIIPADEVESFRNALRSQLESLTDESGAAFEHIVRYPQELYRSCNGTPPDLLVYCGGLRLRSIGTVGHDGAVTSGNDTGPDDANHDFDGVIVANASALPGSGTLAPMSILDVAPTVLDLLGVPIPETMSGQPLAKRVAA